MQIKPVIHLLNPISALILSIAFAMPAVSFAQGKGRVTGKSPRKPNVILIVADDLGYGDLGVYGQKIIRTPNLDKLSAEGIRFTQYYSGSPVCAPSRCVMLTGNTTGHSYIRDNEEVGEWDSYQGQMPLKKDTYTLGTLFQNAGYKTACIGKWGLGGPGSTGIPENEGFDYFYGYLCQRQAHNHYPSYLFENHEKVVLDNPPYPAHQKLTGNPALTASYAGFSGNAYAPEMMTVAAKRYITAHKDSSFFLYLTYALPHLALQVPDIYLDIYKGKIPDKPYTGEFGYLPQYYPNACYAAMVTALDDYVGQVMECVKAAGLDSSTVILFTSDNGATFNLGGYDPAVFNSNGPFKAGKATLYEGGIRVPMIVRWPGKVAGGRVADLVCAAWDLMPTFASIAGQKTPVDADGISLLPEISGVKGQKQHPWLYWEFMGNSGWQAVRIGNWKIVRKHMVKDPGRRLEIYDLSTDTGETKNVVAQHPDILLKAKEIFWQRRPSENTKWNFTPVPGRKRTKN
jgi:arylsulfatase A